MVLITDCKFATSGYNVIDSNKRSTCCSGNQLPMWVETYGDLTCQCSTHAQILNWCPIM